MKKNEAANKPKHTPGPWKSQGTVVSAKGSGCIAAAYAASTSNVSVVGIEVAEANARLIAAAPDLLAALEKLVKHRTVPCRFTITKKADDCYTCGKTPDGQGGTRVCDQCAEVLDARAAISKAEGK